MTSLTHRLGNVPLLCLLGLVAAVSAACSNSPSAATTSTSSTTSAQSPSSTSGVTPSTASQNLPAVGIYTDGPASSPHYKLDLTTSSGSTLAGSITFVFQDGSTSSPTNFTGSASNGQATLTMTSGTQFTATYAQSTIVLGSCTTYLQYAKTAGQCSFARTA